VVARLSLSLSVRVLRFVLLVLCLMGLAACNKFFVVAPSVPTSVVIVTLPHTACVYHH